MKTATEGLDITIVNSESLLEEMCDYLQDKDPIAFDTETTSTDVLRSDFRLVGMSFAASADKAFYIPLGHKQPRQTKWTSTPIVQLPERQVKGRLSFIWNDKRIIAHQLKYDYKVMLVSGVELQKPWYCTMVGQYILDHRERQGLKLLTERKLNRAPLRLKQVTRDSEAQYDLTYTDIAYTAKYAAPDASNCFELYLWQMERLSEAQKELLFQVDVPILQVVAEMELAGLDLDEVKVHQLHSQLDVVKVAAENEMRSLLTEMRGSDEMLGSKFTPTKPDHCMHVLYDLFDLPFQAGSGRPKDGGGKQAATDKKAINKFLADDRLMKSSPKIEGFLRALLKWREVAKLNSTYTLNLLDHRGADDRLHGDFQTTRTNSGRLACKTPATQTMPTRDDQYNIRSVFIAGSDDDVLLVADYDTQEMRITAALSG